jgi:hypothetical protein
MLADFVQRYPRCPHVLQDTVKELRPIEAETNDCPNCFVGSKQRLVVGLETPSTVAE